MTVPFSDGVADGLRRLSDEMFGNDDGTYVAVAILLKAGDQPDIVICDRTGNFTKIADLKLGMSSDVEIEAPWSLQDIRDADEYLSAICGEFDGVIRDETHWERAGATIVDLATRRLESIREWRIALELERDAALIDKPHVCACGCRFSTKRGLAQHKAKNRYCVANTRGRS